MASLLKYFVEHPSVTIDSRNIKPGQIFFAIKGEHFDGNDFVMQALQEGAAYCIASNPVFHGHDRIIVVDDTLEALQDLAREYRGTFKFPVL
ncbi:MAG TPA: Mur ligase domain-containing protein, partial [Saprospiraceae bacterium]|nr:Mur ligase domain-containing protein [Saprospiraceae bacterium]